MASKVMSKVLTPPRAKSLLSSSTVLTKPSLPKNHNASMTIERTAVTSADGKILSEPFKIRLGLLKIFVVAIPGILLGATIAKNGAAWLEENEIFIPDDDDDD